MELTPAAGINPYVTTCKGKRYFLIGKEVSTHRWSGFTGGYEDIDGTPMNTAIRELIEESCNIFLPMKEEIAQRITNGDCTLIRNKTPRNRDLYAWFIEFPLSLKYQELEVKFQSNRLKTYNPHYREKERIKWVSEDKIFDEHLGRGFQKDLKTFLL